MDSINLKLVTNYSIRSKKFNSSDSIFNLKEVVAEHDGIDTKRSNALLVRTSELLDDANSLEFYKLQNGDEIFVTNPPRYSLSSDSLHNSSKEKVTQEDIDEATKDLEPKNNDKKEIIRPESMELLQRKVFITLLEIAQNILCLNKTTSDLFEYVHEEINRQSVHEWELVQPDINLMGKIMEMGFSREVAENALIRSNNSLKSALSMVCTQTKNEGCGNDDHGASLNNENSKLNPDDDIEIQWLRDTKNQLFVKPMKGYVILKSYRNYDRKFFRPALETREELVDVGFDEFEVNEALRLSNNYEPAAMELLSSGSVPILVQDHEILQGLPHDSFIIKTLLATPEIQLGLLNGCSLLAFVKIVDNPKNLPHWLTKMETHRIIQKIINIVNKCTIEDTLSS